MSGKVWGYLETAKYLASSLEDVENKQIYSTVGKVYEGGMTLRDVSWAVARTVTVGIYKETFPGTENSKCENPEATGKTYEKTTRNWKWRTCWMQTEAREAQLIIQRSHGCGQKNFV